MGGVSCFELMRLHVGSWEVGFEGCYLYAFCLEALQHFRLFHQNVGFL